MSKEIINLEFDIQSAKELGISYEELKKRMNFLSKSLGKEFIEDLASGPTIKGVVNIRNLVEFSQNLEKLYGIKGFDKFIKEFNNVRKARPENYYGWNFEFTVALFLEKQNIDFEFKPSIKRKTPDIKIKGKTPVYIECKNWHTTEEIEHLEEYLFQVTKKIKKKIKEEIDLVVTLHKKLTDEETYSLIREIQDKLKYGLGKYRLSNAELEIKESSGEGKLPGKMNIATPGQLFDIEPEIKYQTMLNVNGKTNVMVIGHEFNIPKKVINIFTAARKQLIPCQANIIVISFNKYLGRKSDYIEAIKKQIKGGKNTRVSGVLLLESFIRWDELVHQSVFLNNPAAEIEIPPYINQKLQTESKIKE